MKALVVYESMFGNTAAVADAVTEGLREVIRADLRPVGQAPTDIPADIDLLVVGGPTHAFSLSRPNTRAEAHRRGAVYGEEEIGIREWLGKARFEHSVAVAAFDTRVGKVRHLPGSAARKVAAIARRRGIGHVMDTESFYVHDTPGPLFAGEVIRARRFGVALGHRVESVVHRVGDT